MITPGIVTVRVYADRPSKEQALAEIRRFFDLLKRGEIEAAEGAIAHQSDDWWPHQVRSMWQDLVGPWLEEQGEDWDLEDDKTWRNLEWLKRIDVDLDCRWDGTSDYFSVNVVYDGVVTDTSAEFDLHRTDEGWVVRRGRTKIV